MVASSTENGSSTTGDKLQAGSAESGAVQDRAQFRCGTVASAYRVLSRHVARAIMHGAFRDFSPKARMLIEEEALPKAVAPEPTRQKLRLQKRR